MQNKIEKAQQKSLRCILLCLYLLELNRIFLVTNIFPLNIYTFWVHLYVLSKILLNYKNTMHPLTLTQSKQTNKQTQLLMCVSGVREPNMLLHFFFIHLCLFKLIHPFILVSIIQSYAVVSRVIQKVSSNYIMQYSNKDKQ